MLKVLYDVATEAAQANHGNASLFDDDDENALPCSYDRRVVEIIAELRIVALMRWVRWHDFAASADIS